MNSSMQAASLLADARQNRRRLEALPIACRPSDLPSAYECQNALVKRLSAVYGGHRIGYKIACTNKSAQELLALDRPFYGKLMSSFSHTSPARLNVQEFFMCIIEPEFAFAIGKDLPPRSEAYQFDEIALAIDSVFPAIEIVDSRYEDWTKVGALSLIADNACNGSWVKGQCCESWDRIDLSRHPVNLYVNGDCMRNGRGDAVMGHPITALTWLANELSQMREGLHAGDLVSTGITCDVYYAQPGDHIIAEFGEIGQVEILF